MPENENLLEGLNQFENEIIDVIKKLNASLEEISKTLDLIKAGRASDPKLN